MTQNKILNLETTNHEEHIRNASQNLKRVLKKTNLIYSEFFSKEYGNNVYIKPENLQVTGSFKIRGAFNKINNLTKEERKRGIIASSAGNHAQGVALSAQKLGIPSVIVMPNITPLIKIEGTKSYGSEVVIHGDVYDESYKESMRLSKEKGYTYVHAFDDYDVICGQGTVGLEIIEELENIDEILVPVGGGGLISGIALIAKSLKPSIRVTGVEPSGALTMKTSLNKGRIMELDHCRTTAEGVSVKKPGELTYNIANKYVDGIIEVTEEDMTEALLMLVEKHKLIAETSGILPLAALRKLNIKNKNVACVVSGGNVDVLTISSLINKGLVSRSRIFCFSVDLPDTPGQLMKISQILSSVNANVIKLEHNQFKATDRYMNVQLEVTAETNGEKHIQQIIELMKKDNFKINRIY
ncbi:threonine ammonia-lyase [Sedimentibacter sp. MB31-C6]|uniref:threonine ammonia-lyase n=1 Tax=Sedimentibacter sp. MB31-C6 TaxID=3109366 RepID=UPI002DDCD373|nr:threonine ammonia-lyase [Sedimentibacter sp. MB36-C1]WSI05385.1 threonine ammonia-lyase [Sedimentibacter sp. MB36-C1]